MDVADLEKAAARAIGKQAAVVGRVFVGVVAVGGEADTCVCV
jgi:hypothetical protein